jgi:hypothetical protein
MNVSLSFRSQALVDAFRKGYRVRNGKVIAPSKKERKCIISSTGYLVFSHRLGNKRSVIPIHRLVAYEKYGDVLFEEDTVVRHLDGNKLNCATENILIGSQSENMFDIPTKQRKLKAVSGIKACSKANRKWSNEEVEAIRVRYYQLKSYKKVMEEFNISSKGTLHYILTHGYMKH